MSPSKSFCPGCKQEVVFEAIGAVRRCPVCGFEFQLGGARAPITESRSSEIVEGFAIVVKVLLLMVVLAVVGLGILFAGCALAFR